jgi:hypothetical protein
MVWSELYIVDARFEKKIFGAGHSWSTAPMMRLQGLVVNG